MPSRPKCRVYITQDFEGDNTATITLMGHTHPEACAAITATFYAAIAGFKDSARRHPKDIVIVHRKYKNGGRL